jgi:hypothetical protein
MSKRNGIRVYEESRILDFADGSNWVLSGGVLVIRDEDNNHLAAFFVWQSVQFIDAGKEMREGAHQ